MYEENDLVEDFQFVISGKLKVVSPNNNKSIFIINSGESIGDLNLLSKKGI